MPDGIRDGHGFVLHAGLLQKRVDVRRCGRGDLQGDVLGQCPEFLCPSEEVGVAADLDQHPDLSLVNVGVQMMMRMGRSHVVVPVSSSETLYHDHGIGHGPEANILMNVWPATIPTFEVA